MAKPRFKPPELTHREVTLRVPVARMDVVRGSEVIATFGGVAAEGLPTQEDLDRRGLELLAELRRLRDEMRERDDVREQMLSRMPDAQRRAVRAAL